MENISMEPPKEVELNGFIYTLKDGQEGLVEPPEIEEVEIFGVTDNGGLDWVYPTNGDMQSEHDEFFQLKGNGKRYDMILRERS